ncbi:GMC family oxidoreductase [Sphingobium sp. EM0848]|uniref:GMC family oxidoreductase n=1 Tax=Sphingobium sp. EM0848 TaxID=2743473 RepID=UPI00159C743D|nr:GMC family oxidoreductase N-terminal domain-containing protein [Sphingobium sp. EM0848]
MIDNANEQMERLLDRAAAGNIGRRSFLAAATALGATALFNSAVVDGALAAGVNQRAHRATMRDSFDYIIIGAGAAGCIIAARLAEAGMEVLLVESGGTDDLAQVATPGIWFTNIGSPRDWRFTANPSPLVNGRTIPMAMGHVLGGGTSINAMLWMRGFAQDFDDWAYNGCDGWAFQDVLPLFRALEDWEGGANEWRGAGGPVHIRTAATDPHPTAAAFIAASRQMGIPVLDDMNAPMREGAGYVNMSITKEGTRASASRAFLRPALSRPNLHLLLDTDATGLLFEGTRCTGVQLQGRDGARAVRASREVIIAGGGMMSAKLLLLSGIGDADASRRLGITPIVDLQGVGRNFQDHPILFGVAYRYRGKMPPRSMTSNAVEAAAYVRSDIAKPVPDLKMVLQQLPFVTPEVQAKFGTLPSDGYTITPALMRPSSRGTFRLSSADWRDKGQLDSNFFSTEHDIETTVRGIELVRELGQAEGFAGIRDAEIVPGRPMTKAELRDFARNAAISFGHPVGTCKMGTDERAVVNPSLRVRGVEALRVCDSSIMPSIVTAPTAAASHMIGLKAVDLILQDHHRPSSS